MKVIGIQKGDVEIYRTSQGTFVLQTFSAERFADELTAQKKIDWLGGDSRSDGWKYIIAEADKDK